MQRPCSGVPSCAFPPRVAAACRRLVSLPYGTSPRGGRLTAVVAPGKRIFSVIRVLLGVAPFPRELSRRPSFFVFRTDTKIENQPPQGQALQKGASNVDFHREGGLGSAHRSRQFTPRCWSPTYQHHPQGINVTPRTPVPDVFSSRTFRRSPLRPLDSQRGTARRELWSAGTAIPAPAKPDASPLRTLRLHRYSRRSEGTGGAWQERSEGTIAHAALAKRQQAQWPWSPRRWRKQEQGQQRKRERCR